MAEKLEILIAATDATRGALEGVKGALGGLGGFVSGALQTGLAAGAVGLGALVTGLASSVHEAMGSEEALGQLRAVLASTHGAAGMTEQALNDLASSLQDTTRFSDETVMGGESMLLTFTSIGKDVFPAATETMLDMSQAMGTDVKGSAIQLGKALNDPINGMSALSRVGVSFTDEQKNLIKKFQESGDIASAQKVILKELQTEFGGAAKAAGQTFAGQIDRLKNKFSDIQESIGGALMPLLKTLADNLLTTLNNPAVQAGIATLTASLGQLASGDVAGALTTAFGPETSAQVMGFVSELSGFVSGTLMPALVTFGSWFMTDGLPALQGLGAEIAANVLPVLQQLGAFAVNVVLPALMAFGAWFMAEGIPQLQAFFGNVQGEAVPIITQLGAAFGAVFGAIQAVVAAVLPIVAQFIKDHGAEIVATLQFAWDSIKAIITLTLQVLTAITTMVFGAIAAFLNQHGAEILAVLSAAWTAIQFVIEVTLTMIQGVLQAALLAVQGNWSGAWEIVKGMLKSAWDWISARLNEALTAFRDLMGIFGIWLRGMWNQLWDDIKNALASAVASLAAKAVDLVASVKKVFTDTNWYQLGVDIFQGIRDGLADKIGKLMDMIRNLIGQMWAAATDAAQAHSPSRLFMQLGGFMAEGLAVGMTGQAALPIGAARDTVSQMIGGAVNTTTNYFNQTINTSAPSENVGGDFRQMMARGRA